LPIVVTAVPGCPTILGVHDVLCTRCTVIYMPPDDIGAAPVIGYLLERRCPGLEWIRLNDEPVTGFKYVARDLAPLVSYQFRVAAVNTIGIGSFSEASEMITTRAQTAPGQPRWPVITKLAGTSVTLQWTAPDDGGAECTGFFVHYGIPGTDTAKYTNERFEADVTTCTLPNLKPKTNYHFAVSAENNVGRGPWSNFSERVKYSGM